MPYVRSRYYREEEKPAGYRRVEAGFGLLEKNTLFQFVKRCMLEEKVAIVQKKMERSSKDLLFV